MPVDSCVATGTSFRAVSGRIVRGKVPSLRMHPTPSKNALGQMEGGREAAGVPPDASPRHDIAGTRDGDATPRPLEETMEKQPGMVSFVGAGPGDPELLTLKGKRLIEEAALLLYAGSMIPPALLDLASPRASVIDAAPLDLEECHSLMLQFARAGQPVVHLHTGDPAVYSALREQLALLDRDGIPWQVVPGITAASAAAAAAGCSFTVPGATQSLIMTRMPGRTPMPEQEALRHLARHGTTLAVYLSAMQARAMQEELEQSLPAATPVICAFRLGWPDQQLIRTRLDLLAGTIEKNGLSRQTVVLVLPGEGEDAPAPRTCGPHTDHD